MAEDQSTIEENKAFATGLFRGAEIVARYMKHRYPLIDGATIRSQTGHRDACLKGLWMRAYVWMQTLARLNDPLDFQAVSAGNRSLLEIAVDLVLLHHDKTNESGWRMHWWGVSEKLKASEQILDFYKTKNLALPDRYEAQKQFYDGEYANVLRMRAALWPNMKNPSQHPTRWTRNGNLFDDILRADQIHGSAIEKEIGSSFEEYYRTEYRKINWRIHSGTAGFWNLPAEAYYLICGFGLKSSADLSMLSTKTVFLDFEDLKVVEGLNEDWENIELQRNLAYLGALKAFHTGQQEDDAEIPNSD